MVKKKDKKTKVKDPHGGDMDYAVQKLKPLSYEQKKDIDEKVKAKHRPKPKEKKK